MHNSLDTGISMISQSLLAQSTFCALKKSDIPNLECYFYFDLIAQKR
jgi:hypothetical protein